MALTEQDFQEIINNGVTRDENLWTVVRDTTKEIFALHTSECERIVRETADHYEFKIKGLQIIADAYENLQKEQERIAELAFNAARKTNPNKGIITAGILKHPTYQSYKDSLK